VREAALAFGIADCIATRVTLSCDLLNPHCSREWISSRLRRWLAPG
jgi:hypothetical protein